MKSFFHKKSLWKGRPETTEWQAKDKFQDEIETAMDISLYDLE